MQAEPVAPRASASISPASVFSLRENWRRLTRRPAFHEPVIDGVRAIAILWVVALHAVFYHTYILPAQVAAIAGHAATGWIMNGDAGVDLFFVISGFLVGSILFREMQLSGGLVLPRFYIRRFLRLAPVYTAVMLLLLAMLSRMPGALRLWNARNIWANMLYINNLLPIGRQFMVWCWSLAIEEQFYLLLPVAILLFMRVNQGRLRIVYALALLSIAIRFTVIRVSGLTLPFLPAPTTPGWNRAFDLIYDKPWVRFGGLLAGATGAYLHLYAAPQLKRFFARTGLVTVLSIASLAVFTHIASTSIGSAFFTRMPALASQLWFAAYRDLLSWVAIFLILAAIHAPRLFGGWLRRILSWQGFYPIAQLSYSIYLVHELLFAKIFPRFAYLFLPRLGPWGALAADCALALAITSIFAVLLYLFVEQPSMRMRSHPAVVRLIGFLNSALREPAPEAARETV